MSSGKPENKTGKRKRLQAEPLQPLSASEQASQAKILEKLLGRSLISGRTADRQDQPSLPDARPSADLAAERPSRDDSAVIRPSRETTEPQRGLAVIRPSFESAGYYKSPNWLDDEVMPLLGVMEQVILRRLFRLSYGFNRQVTDSVSIARLCEKCGMKKTAVKETLNRLEAKGLIERHSDKTRNPAGGNRYAVLTRPEYDLAVVRPSREATKPKDGHITKALKKQYEEIKRELADLFVGSNPTAEEIESAARRKCAARGIAWSDAAWREISGN